MNNNAQFSPGPWALERDRAKSLSIYAGSTFVGEVYNEVDEPSAQENANAHLIAAAPAMYEALQAITNTLRAIDEDYDLRDSYKQAQAALAQAEGRRHT